MRERIVAGGVLAATVAGCTLVVSTSGLSDGVADAGSSGDANGGVVSDAAMLPGDGSAVSPATSCKALLAATPPPPSGVYTIDPDGSGPAPPFAAYCDLAGSGGGWTLLFKTAPELVGDDPYWTDTRTYQPDKPDLDLNAAKLAGYMTMPFEAVRVGIREQNATDVRYLVLPVKATSLRELFTGDEVLTSAGRDAWLSLIVMPTSQKNCNAEGFNLRRANRTLRVGILFNDEADCLTSDAYIGLGGWQGSGHWASGGTTAARNPTQVGYLEVR